MGVEAELCGIRAGSGAAPQRPSIYHFICFLQSRDETPIIVLRSPSTAYRSHSAALGATTLSPAANTNSHQSNILASHLYQIFRFLAVVQSVKSWLAHS